MNRKIVSHLTDFIKYLATAILVALPIYFIAHLMGVDILMWRQYETYQGEMYKTSGSVIPLVIGIFVSSILLENKRRKVKKDESRD